MTTNLVEQIAKMIDTEGAYAVAYPSTAPSEPIPFTTRQKYFQAKYELLAIEIVKMLMAIERVKIRSDIIAWEKAGWLRMGVPINDPKFKEQADRIIEAKYSTGGGLCV